MLFLLSIASCKPSGSSGTYSLDNLAAGNVILRKNECGVSPSTEISPQSVPAAATIIPALGKNAEENQQTLRAEALKVLSSVPVSVQRLFAAVGGKITITDAANQICTDHLKSGNRKAYEMQGRETIQACAVYFAVPGKSTVLNIVLAPDVREIRHGMLRVFGSLIAEFFSRLELINGRLTVTDSQSEAFVVEKSWLSSEFVKDVHLSSAFDIDGISFLFGESGFNQLQQVLERIGNNPEANVMNYVNFAESIDETGSDEGLEAREELTMSYVFADAFDSAFCNNWGDFDHVLANKISRGEGTCC